MTPENTSALTHLFEALDLRSPTEFVFAGKAVRLLETFTPDALQLHPVVTNLQSLFYEHAYCRRLNGKVHPPIARAGTDLTPLFEEANAGREWRDRGWHIYNVSANVVYAEKGGRVHMFEPSQVTPHNGGSPAAGVMADVVVGRRAPESMQPGFYIALGEVPYEMHDETTAVRFYFNVQESGAPRLMRAITRLFNRFEVPFRFKSLRYSGIYTRRDAAVLFIGRRYFQIAARLVTAAHAEVRDVLNDDVPLLTKAMLPGVGFAEDPGNGDSFGTNRCRLLAQSAWEAFSRGRTSVAERLDEAARQFRLAGIDPAKPYLRPGTADIYDMP